MIIGFPAECMTCVLGKRVRSLPADWSDERCSAYLREAMRIIVEADPSEGMPLVVLRIEALDRDWGLPQPDYGPIKRHWNQRLMALAPRLRADIASAADPLARAMQYARAANYIDFGAVEDVNEAQLMALLEAAVADLPDAAEYARFRRELASARSLVYLTDNSGEIVADRLLLEQLRALRPDLRLTAIVRGQDVLNDATLEDARMVGLDEVAEVVGNGSGLAGSFLDQMDARSLALIGEADVIVAKGQANFETLQGCGLNIYYLFLSKCGRFERRFGFKKMQGVLVNERRLKPGSEGRA